MDELESGVVHGEPKDMKPAIGVDVGATLAKLAIRDEGGALHFESLPAREIDRVGDRVADFNPIRVGLTGGGASSLSERFAGISALQNEFESWGKGARHLLDAENLLKESRNLLVSLGTGTSVLLMDGDATHRVGGTALGGGTVLGLSSALSDTLLGCNAPAVHPSSSLSGIVRLNARAAAAQYSAQPGQGRI